MDEPADFAQLRQTRLGLAQSLADNNADLTSMLSGLYPDNAHFIYELLQNAEDVHATTIEFTLTDDHLTVTHNGQRPFYLKDIESITTLGNSTKKEIDEPQIGKFGIGFKAVFTYTARPEIRSGHYSFAIENLFVPQWIPEAAEPDLTSFTFPFDRDDKPCEEACMEIARGLKRLDERTLLFLSHIKTITYKLPGGAVGILERIAVDEEIIRIRNGDDESHWLRLTGPASVERDGGHPLEVAAAFRLASAEQSAPTPGQQEGAGGDREGRLVIVPVEKGDVSIYFPAVKEPSGLRFHIHAPFASTPARDSVKQDVPGNITLVDDIAAVIARALPRLRDEGLITDSFLQALPNSGDPIEDPYTRIRATLTACFNDVDITPVRGAGGGYAAARTLVASPSVIRNRLEAGDLPFLFDLGGFEVERPPRWIRERGGRGGTFLSDLDTIDFGWDELATCLASAQRHADADDPLLTAWRAWLEGKSDARLSDIYELLGKGKRIYRLRFADLTAVPIVRLRQSGTLEHVRGPDAYLPSSPDDAEPSRVPPTLAYFEDDEESEDGEQQERAANLKAFYTAAGVRRWNETARIEQQLAIYRDRSTPALDGDFLARHLEDIRAFVRFARSNGPSVRRAFAQVPFLAALQANGSWRWVTPLQTFVDVPFSDTGLSALYPRIALEWKDGRGYAYDQEPYPLAGIYIEIEGIEDLLHAAGARVGLEIIKVGVKANNKNKKHNPQFNPYWASINRENDNTQSVDWWIEDLDDIIERGDQGLLRTLWRTVVTAPAAKASALYQANMSAPRHSIESRLVQTLKAAAWVMDRNGDLRIPREMTLDDLPDDWQQPPPDSLAHRLEIGAEATRHRQKSVEVTEYLREKGLDEDAINFLHELRESGLTLTDVRTVIAELTTARIPAGASEDARRRAAIAAMDALQAPQHTTTIRQRRVVEGQGLATAASKAYLRGHYTDSTGAMACQACQRPLPFKTKEGEWYFEAVRLVTARKTVHTSNAIALCPLCAALYRYARETTNDTVLSALSALVIRDGQGTVDIHVRLNGKPVTIVFTGKHAIDLQAALGAAGDER